ncbi:MAG: Hsp20/alpha crystallin family protein [Promethearchaeia archaeon]
MPRNNENKDEDDEDEPFNFFDIFKNPQKIFENKQFQRIFKNLMSNLSQNEQFKEMFKNFDFENFNFNNFDPDDFRKMQKMFKDNFGSKGVSPFMTGFNVNFGSNGKPVVKSFGNLKPKKNTNKPEASSFREPLVDVNQDEENVIIVAEMPGIEKKDIELKSSPQEITISTKESAKGRKYYKELDLPAPVDSDHAKARLQNGILEVKLKKLSDKQEEIQLD